MEDVEKIDKMVCVCVFCKDKAINVQETNVFGKICGITIELLELLECFECTRYPMYVHYF